MSTAIQKARKNYEDRMKSAGYKLLRTKVWIKPEDEDEIRALIEPFTVSAKDIASNDSTDKAGFEPATS